jgi:hypothetical protein
MSQKPMSREMPIALSPVIGRGPASGGKYRRALSSQNRRYRSETEDSHNNAGAADGFALSSEPYRSAQCRTGTRRPDRSEQDAQHKLTADSGWLKSIDERLTAYGNRCGN